MRKAVLVGTSHDYQVSHSGQSDFEDFISSICKARHITAIAEEMSLEALREKNAAESLPASIAYSMNIPHRYCDPDRQQRKNLDIRQMNEIKAAIFLVNGDKARIDQEIHESDLRRERYWWGQLLELNVWPTLFVCGANHVDSFRNLLETNGISVEIAARDWSPRNK